MSLQHLHETYPIDALCSMIGEILVRQIQNKQPNPLEVSAQSSAIRNRMTSLRENAANLNTIQLKPSASMPKTSYIINYSFNIEITKQAISPIMLTKIRGSVYLL